MSDPIESWTDEELSVALRRAWREAARCISESRANPKLTILQEAADGAQSFYYHLLSETRRRAEIRRLVGIEAWGQCSACSEPNAPGKTLCVGHHRMSSYKPGAEYAPNH